MFTFSVFSSSAVAVGSEEKGRHLQGATYDLFSLSSESQEWLSLAISLYEQGYRRYTGVSGKRRQDYQDELQKVSQQSNSVGFKTLGRVLRDYSRDDKKTREHAWREQQTHKLAQPRIWSALQQAAVGELQQAQLKALRGRWQAQAKFANHHPQALLDAYYLLPHLQSWFARALAELDRRKQGFHPFSTAIPESFYNVYRNYLLHQQALVQREYANITHTMGAVLAQVAASDMLSSDILIGVINRFKTHGLMKRQFAKDKTAQNHITAETFRALHQAIDNHGSVLTRKRLSELPWFDNKTVSKVSIRSSEALQTSKQLLAARLGVAKLIPEKPPWPAWLFVGRHIRYHFFDKTYYPTAKLDSLLRTLQHTGERTTLTPSSLQPLAALGTRMQRLLRDEAQRAEAAQVKVQRWPWRLFNSKTFALLNTYQGHLKQQQEHLLESQITLLEQLSGSITAGVFTQVLESTQTNSQIQIQTQTQRQKNDQDQKQDLSLAALMRVKQQIDVFITQVEAGSVNCSSALKARLRVATHKLRDVLRTKETELLRAKRHQQQRAYQEELLKPLQAAFGEPTIVTPISIGVAQDAVDNVLAYRRQLDTKAPLAQAFLQRLDGLLSKAMKALQKTFAPRYELTPDLTTQGVSAIVQGRLLQALGNKAMHSQLNDALDDYAFAYLERLGDGSAVAHSHLALREHHQLSEAQEQVILTLGSAEQKAQFERLKRLRQSGRLQELGQLAKTYRDKLAQRIRNRHFARDFKRLDKALFAYLGRVSHLSLSQDTLSYLRDLCERMAQAGVTHAMDYPQLTAVDKSFLGLNPLNSFEQWLEKAADTLHLDGPNGSRKPLQAVVNICALLRIEAKRLPYIRDRAAQQRLVAAIKNKIQRQVKRYGNHSLHQFIQDTPHFTTPIAWQCKETAPKPKDFLPKDIQQESLSYA